MESDDDTHTHMHAPTARDGRDKNFGWILCFTANGANREAENNTPTNTLVIGCLLGGSRSSRLCSPLRRGRLTNASHKAESAMLAKKNRLADRCVIPVGRLAYRAVELV